ncbi:uncharacterized protein LOC114517841 [Dendronephthya gigantea]|uniref:uncharacterized protein LOC114517841 n=1 Tax=Dendronephthya gigantea TaxID=151771 RepID=UPI0010690D7E|nr:uncharacterized protein LOC114517841 [Dendronephthya gigantea]
MKCVKLNKTSKPTKVKNLSDLQQIPAQEAFEKFAKESDEGSVLTRLLKVGFSLDDISSLRKNVGDRVATLGSDGVIYCNRDDGMFSAILAAYNNHWKLRTSPDDWWFCVIKLVALAIDRNAGKESVRQMFVEHEGKKTLCVDVPTLCIYDVDYNVFFQQMSEQIAENIKVPSYVDLVTADFTTTTPATKIASQITIMSSLQEFFDYDMKTSCGIPAIEMLGSKEDWEHLGEKLEKLKEILKPILDDIGLPGDWWKSAEEVFKKLLKTYEGNPDKKWWDKILSFEGASFSGQISGYTGWITRFIEGSSERIAPETFTSGLATVPLKIKRPDGFEDTAALVAGMLGFTLYEEKIPVVQPFQGWSMLLPENSPFRSKTAA